MTPLVPLGEAGYAAYLEEAIPGYAADKVASGQWSEAESLELSRKSLEELLPQGLATPDNLLFSIVDETAEPVGMLWIAVQERAGQRIAYVYDVSIEPAHRRRGHASRAFHALEDEVRAMGLAGIGLHVFGHNASARALYERLGYVATNISMFKPLAPTPADALNLPRAPEVGR